MFEERKRASTHTFLPSGMVSRAISTLAWAKTSAEADMLVRKSVESLDTFEKTQFRSQFSYSHTMHGSLCTHSRAETHGAGNKVRKDLVRRRRALGHVFLEAGDLQG